MGSYTRFRGDCRRAGVNRHKHKQLGIAADERRGGGGREVHRGGGNREAPVGQEGDGGQAARPQNCPGNDPVYVRRARG